MNAFLTVYLCMISLGIVSHVVLLALGNKKQKLVAVVSLAVGVPMALWAASLRGIW